MIPFCWLFRLERTFDFAQTLPLIHLPASAVSAVSLMSAALFKKKYFSVSF